MSTNTHRRPETMQRGRPRDLRHPSQPLRRGPRKLGAFIPATAGDRHGPPFLAVVPARRRLALHPVGGRHRLVLAGRGAVRPGTDAGAGAYAGVRLVARVLAGAGTGM